VKKHDRSFRLIFRQTIPDDLNENQTADLIVSTEQCMAHQDVVDELTKKTKGTEYVLRLAQPNSTFDTRTTSVFFLRSRNKDIFDAPLLYSSGKNYGLVGFVDVVDKNLANHGFVSLCVVVVPTMHLPEKNDSNTNHEFLEVAGQEVFHPKNYMTNRKTLFSKRLDDLTKKVAEAMNKRACVFVGLNASLKDELQLLKDYGLLRASSADGDYAFMYSPAMASWTQQVVFDSHGGLMLDLCFEKLSNYYGVFCQTEGELLYGFGRSPCRVGRGGHTAEQNSITRMGQLRNDRTDEFLELSDDVIQTAVPDRDSTFLKKCIREVFNGGDTIHLDLEFGGENKSLGTITILHECPRLKVTLFRKQVLGDDLFTEVREMMTKLLIDGMKTIVVYDFNEDEKVLIKEDILSNDKKKAKIIDLKHTMESAFPEAYTWDEKKRSPTTMLGLKHFVQMSMGVTLKKSSQNAKWHTQEVQEDKTHIEYALLDAYAIYNIHPYAQQDEVKSK